MKPQFHAILEKALIGYDKLELGKDCPFPPGILYRALLPAYVEWTEACEDKKTHPVDRMEAGAYALGMIAGQLYVSTLMCADKKDREAAADHIFEVMRGAFEAGYSRALDPSLPIEFPKPHGDA